MTPGVMLSAPASGEMGGKQGRNFVKVTILLLWASRGFQVTYSPSLLAWISNSWYQKSNLGRKIKRCQNLLYLTWF